MCDHGPLTQESWVEYGTRSKRQAWLVYSQGVWDIKRRIYLNIWRSMAEDQFRGKGNDLVPTVINAFNSATLVLRSPFTHFFDNRLQIPTLFRELVFRSRWVLSI